MASRFILPYADVGDGIVPEDGAKLFFYEEGTLTPKNTYSDEALATPNTNPVISDSDGLFGDIWFDDGSRFKVVLKDKNDVQQWEADPIIGAISSSLRTFSTLAELDASTSISVGDYVTVLGRVSDDDGGGNTYKIVNAGTADGGSIINLSGSGLKAKGLFPNGYNAKQWGAVGDAVTDDSTALDAADAFADVIDLLGATYEYGGSFTPTSMFVNGTVVDDNITQQFDVQRKGQVTGNDLSTQGYLAHDDGRGGNTASAWENTLVTVRGTDTSPDSDTMYAHTANFTELHTDAVLNVAQSVWGNPYKVGATVSEAIAEANFEGELNGGIFRAYSTNVPGNLVDSSKGILVGISSIAQTNTGAGNAPHNVWGANIIAAQTSGNAPVNIVGIEVDVLNDSSSAGILPGDPGATNYTGFWAQSAASAGSQSDTAFLATNTVTSDGWRQILQAKGKIQNWAVYLETSVNAPTARGIYAKTAWGANTGRVMELWAVGEQFRVDGASDNPVWARMGSALRKLEVGAVNSGGAGYRVVRTLN